MLVNEDNQHFNSQVRYNKVGNMAYIENESISGILQKGLHKTLVKAYILSQKPFKTCFLLSSHSSNNSYNLPLVIYMFITFFETVCVCKI
jgi:hypothetical protein